MHSFISHLKKDSEILKSYPPRICDLQSPWPTHFEWIHFLFDFVSVALPLYTALNSFSPMQHHHKIQDFSCFIWWWFDYSFTISFERIPINWSKETICANFAIESVQPRLLVLKILSKLACKSKKQNAVIGKQHFRIRCGERNIMKPIQLSCNFSLIKQL